MTVPGHPFMVHHEEMEPQADKNTVTEAYDILNASECYCDFTHGFQIQTELALKFWCIVLNRM